MTSRVTALFAIIASAVSCIFLTEHRASVDLTAAPVGQVAVCVTLPAASGWAAYRCIYRSVPAEQKAGGGPTRTSSRGGARGMSMTDGDVFAKIVEAQRGGSSDGDTPETVMVGVTVPQVRRIPEPTCTEFSAVQRSDPEPEPDGLDAEPAAETEAEAEPTMVLVPGLERPAYDTWRRIFVLPAEASPEERVRLMLTLMRERR